MPENIPDWKVERAFNRAIDRLVREGKVVRTLVHGKSGVRLTDAGKEAAKKQNSSQLVGAE